MLSNEGIRLVAKNTIINDYIINRLVEMGIDRIWVYETLYEDTEENKIVAAKIKEEYIKNVVLIKSVLNDLSSGKPLNFEKISEVSSSIYNEINESSFVIKWIDRLKTIDEYTYTHSFNTAFYSMLIAKWLKLTDRNMKEIIKAGLLHDIGKTKVPGKILNKPGPLTKDEYEEMKKHPVYGYQILNSEESVIGEIKNAVLFHHERVDGSGYPNGISDDKIGIYAKIIGVADVYDAITSDRIYKKRATPFDAFNAFMSTGISGYDMAIVNTFLNNISSYYIGAKVILNNGKRAEIVYIPPHDILNPVISIDSDFIDLSERKGLKIVHII
jgi:putative nucleotidyltransferase with HDIG domain